MLYLYVLNTLLDVFYVLYAPFVFIYLSLYVFLGRFGTSLIMSSMKCGPLADLSQFETDNATLHSIQCVWLHAMAVAPHDCKRSVIRFFLPLLAASQARSLGQCFCFFFKLMICACRPRIGISNIPIQEVSWKREQNSIRAKVVTLQLEIS
jgi:hypothetical protein